MDVGVADGAGDSVIQVVAVHSGDDFDSWLSQAAAPLMDFSMTIGHGKSASPIMVGCGCVHDQRRSGIEKSSVI